MMPVVLTVADTRFPARLRERFGAGAPDQLFPLGNLGLLALPKATLSHLGASDAVRLEGNLYSPPENSAGKVKRAGFGGRLRMSDSDSIMENSDRALRQPGLAAQQASSNHAEVKHNAGDHGNRRG